MKLFNFKMYGSDNPIILPNGDKYDSKLDIIDAGKIIFTSNKINVDPSVEHPGGRLAVPLYCYGIVFEMYGYPALCFFKNNIDYNKITDWKQLTADQRTFPSAIPNPNQGGKMEMSLINFHIGRLDRDGSQGCFTYHPIEVGKLKRIINKPGEIVTVKIA